MPLIETTVATHVRDSFRVQQVAGMFDLPSTRRQAATFRVEVPAPDENWQIGAVVGPSGSGKTTIARAAFGDRIYVRAGWDDTSAVIDGFGDLPISQITRTLTAVGFGSPPSWLKPYRVLSGGEQFRCDLARALLSAERNARSAERTNDDSNVDLQLVVFDEFTSVVDRRVAKIASAAVGKAIRRGHVRCRLVAVSCHYDMLDWLEPDWMVDMADGSLTRGRLRRPHIKLQVAACRHAAWRHFARHHYLSGQLSRAARCYVAFWEHEPVALCAVVALYGHRGRRRIHRLVTLPDFQGIGIGGKLLDHVALHLRRQGHRVNITTSHPAVIGFCRNSDRWQAVSLSRRGRSGSQQKYGKLLKSARGRPSVSFEFVGLSP